MEDIIADQTEASATTKGTRKDQSQTPKTTEDLITDPIEARLLNSSEMFEDSVPQKHASVLSETVPRLGMYPKLSDPSTYWDGIQKEKVSSFSLFLLRFVFLLSCEVFCVQPRFRHIEPNRKGWKILVLSPQNNLNPVLL